MGLDSVEFVLEIEDAFGIEFTDDEAASIATIGSMCDIHPNARFVEDLQLD